MKTAYVHATVLDGTKDMQPRPDCTVVVENGKITEMGSGLPAPADARAVDLTGCWMVPGLINLHVHLPGSGAPKKKQQDSTKAAQMVMSNPLTRWLGKKLCASYAETELLSGVTTIRTVGGLGNLDSQIRDEINAGKRRGPRMLVCNQAVSVPGGHMTGSVAMAAQSEADCRELVSKTVAEKPDWIKVMITGGVLDATVKGEPGVLKMPPAYVKACCEEAHKNGYKVAAHVESPEGVRVALENGVDTIEHGAEPDADILELFRQRGVADICTISPAVPLATFDESIVHSTEMTRYNGGVVLKGIVDCARACLDNGITVGLGTDTACPFVTHYDMWRELEYFRLYTGVSAAFALHTATQINAEILGIQEQTGTIAHGKDADLLVVKADPLADLSALRTPALVVARGREVKEPRIKKIPACEQALDDAMQKLVQSAAEGSKAKLP